MTSYSVEYCEMTRSGKKVSKKAIHNDSRSKISRLTPHRPRLSRFIPVKLRLSRGFKGSIGFNA